eukprot:SAG11_NODE_531_length_8710_cov_33.573569_6_plen_93_part_00
MNILDLNDDIMSKVKHNIFLRKIMKHKEDKFNYEGFDWDKWEYLNLYDTIVLENGLRATSLPRSFLNTHDSDFSLTDIEQCYADDGFLWRDC